jgi:hypothetical protein
MAVCAFCGSEETELYFNGVPICLKCEEKKRLGLLPPLPPRNEEPPHRPDAN